MSLFIEKNRKKLFWGIILLSFGFIFIWNILTPYWMDDLIYATQARTATSIWDLVMQQYEEYLSNSGRVVGQFNIRLMLIGPKMIFNVVNSIMFQLLAVLMYLNISSKKKYDLRVILLCYFFLWAFSVMFGQTILWICGACNYLWGSVFILGYVTCFKYISGHWNHLKPKGLFVVILILYGIVAGWCNENTSGGGLFLIILLTVNDMMNRKSRKIPLYSIVAAISMAIGMIGMVSAPGVSNRSTQMASDDNYTGFVGFLSRLYKVTLVQRNLFFMILVMLAVLAVILVSQRHFKCFKDIRNDNMTLFTIAYLATAYVLALIPTTADRAFFGAGIFLFIACIQGIVHVSEKDTVYKIVKNAMIAVFCLWFFFMYLDNTVNIARIFRDENERIELILEEKYSPDCDSLVVVPELHEEFRTPYSAGFDAQMTDDPENWINIFYEMYYDIGNITAIPREDWEGLYGE